MIFDFFIQQGFVLIPDVISRRECEKIGARIEMTSGSVGSRSLLSEGWCDTLAKRIRAHPSVAKIVPAQHVAVQCTYFEKSAECNWLVSRHQDLCIPVAEKIADPLLGGWTEKEGILFVQPPTEILEQLVAIRLHLDPCTINDGPLKVVPGSHLRGRIPPEGIVAARQDLEVVCPSEVGGVLAIRPLLLHASSKSKGTGRRRVLHFVFGPRKLQNGLNWRYVKSV